MSIQFARPSRGKKFSVKADRLKYRKPPHRTP